MAEILIKAGLLIAIPLLAIVIILLLANLGAYFTKIEQGTTVFISAGESLRAIWPNVGGHRISKAEDLDGRRWLVPAKTDEDRTESFFYNSFAGTLRFQKWLWKTFGVRFISWFWPHIHVQSFDIRKGGRRRVEARTEVKPDAPLRSRMVDSSEETLVNSLLFLVPRPVYLEGLELAGDNSRINLLLLPVFQQVIPALPVYYLKGDFFTLLDAAIEAAMVDFFATHRVAVHRAEGMEEQFALDSYEPPKDGQTTPEGETKEQYETKYAPRHLTYALWLKLTKGERSPLEQHLRPLNISWGYHSRLKEAASQDPEKQELVKHIEKLTQEKPADISGRVSQMIPSGIVPRFGFALVSFRVVEWEPHLSTVDLAKALLARETRFHTAEGVRKEAEGQRDAILARATGESSRYERLVTALIDKGVRPDEAARVVGIQVRTENIRDSKVVTYVEGGEGPVRSSVMVPAPPSEPSTS